MQAQKIKEYIYFAGFIFILVIPVAALVEEGMVVLFLHKCATSPWDQRDSSQQPQIL
eukprot:m.8159 g.8159  ORF g.8159 m.8159 type:complete len:57 (-) comp3033_c0_seq1:818-988(-)